MESATENNHELLNWPLERVKTCGKSARILLVIVVWGKPYLEQDKQCVRLFVPYKRAGCCSDKWLPHYTRYSDRIRLMSRPSMPQGITVQKERA